MKSKDTKGNAVSIGDSIRVLEIDKRITEHLPNEEKEALASLIGNVFKVEKINSDGSMMVSKTWIHPEAGEVIGHDVAIFPKGALLVTSS